MPPMDYNQFKKRIIDSGYSIGHSTKHHTILDSQGQIVERFAVAHKKGGKKYVKAHYVSKIIKSLGI